MSTIPRYIDGYVPCSLTFPLKGKVFYGPEPPSGESTTTECGVNYQLLAVITEVAQWGAPSCNLSQPVTDHGARGGRSNWLVALPTLKGSARSSTYCTVLTLPTNSNTCCTNWDSNTLPRECLWGHSGYKTKHTVNTAMYCTYNFILSQYKCMDYKIHIFIYHIISLNEMINFKFKINFIIWTEIFFIILQDPPPARPVPAAAYRCAQRPLCGRGGRHEDAPLLSLRGHSQHCIQDGEQRTTLVRMHACITMFVSINAGFVKKYI